MLEKKSFRSNFDFFFDKKFKYFRNSDCQSVMAHLKYISKTIIGIYNHDDDQRAPFNFKNVTEIIMDLIKLMPKLHDHSNVSVCKFVKIFVPKVSLRIFKN